MTICTAFLVAFTMLPFSAFAQATSAVPFVGCPSDGQQGPQPAPESPPQPVLVDPAAAPRLAYYAAGVLPGILGPRGWHCFGVYGSSGSYLFVTPQPKPIKTWFQDPKHDGPAIIASYNLGETSGRFTVADVISRIFPAHIAFVTKMVERSDLPKDFHVSPYSGDTYNAKSDRIVEFSTAANQVGLGTAFSLKPSRLAINGIAILVGDTPDLLQINVRLEPQLTSLTPHIFRQAEIDARRLATQ